MHLNSWSDFCSRIVSTLWDRCTVEELTLALTFIYVVNFFEEKSKTNPWTRLSASLDLCVKETPKDCHLGLNPSSPPCGMYFLLDPKYVCMHHLISACILITLILEQLYFSTSNLANSVSLPNISVRPEVSLFISSSHLDRDLKSGQRPKKSKLSVWNTLTYNNFWGCRL